MNYYFQNKDRQSALYAAAQSWLGTPFFPAAQSRGHGVDCVRYAAALMEATGALTNFTFPVYTLDSAKHTTRSQLLDYLLNTAPCAGRLVFVPVHGPRLPGDLYALRSGRTDHHLAVHLPWEKVTHCIEDAGVVIHEASDEDFRKRILYILRVLEP